MKSVLTGASQTIFVAGGQLQLGRWQGIFFCEFDGPRERRLQVQGRARPVLIYSLADCAPCAAVLKFLVQMTSLGIYVQVPFCQTKCTYCNFHTGVVSSSRFAPYVSAVCREIRGARRFVSRRGHRSPGRCGR